MNRPALCSRLHTRFRRAYVRLLLKHAAFDIEVMQADLAAMPAQIRHHRRRMEALQRELASLEART